MTPVTTKRKNDSTEQTVKKAAVANESEQPQPQVVEQPQAETQPQTTTEQPQVVTGKVDPKKRFVPWELLLKLGNTKDECKTKLATYFVAKNIKSGGENTSLNINFLSEKFTDDWKHVVPELALDGTEFVLSYPELVTYGYSPYVNPKDKKVSNGFDLYFKNAPNSSKDFVDAMDIFNEAIKIVTEKDSNHSQCVSGLPYKSAIRISRKHPERGQYFHTIFTTQYEDPIHKIAKDPFTAFVQVFNDKREPLAKKLTKANIIPKLDNGKYDWSQVDREKKHFLLPGFYVSGIATFNHNYQTESWGPVFNVKIIIVRDSHQENVDGEEENNDDMVAPY